VPRLLDYVRRGEVDLSTLLLLRNFIDEENAEELIRATRCRSKRQIQRILESRPPRAGAPPRRKMASSSRSDSLLGRLDEIAHELYLLEVAIKNETRILIERARSLLAETSPNSTLADLVHRAFEALVDALESAVAEARAKRSPQSAPGKAGYVPRDIRQAVFLRDGFQCAYVSSCGERCRAIRYLEVDHIVPRAHGGRDDMENLRCVCRAHNQYLAEQLFGRQFIRSRIRTRQHRQTTRRRVGEARLRRA
jgi:hypothetical protein